MFRANRHLRRRGTRGCLVLVVKTRTRSALKLVYVPSRYAGLIAEVSDRKRMGCLLLFQAHAQQGHRPAWAGEDCADGRRGWRPPGFQKSRRGVCMLQQQQLLLLMTVMPPLLLLPMLLRLVVVLSFQC